MAVPAQDVAGILLGFTTPTPEERAAADLNGDGVVDAADLLLLSQSESIPGVRFLSTTARVREQDTVLQIPVVFTTPFTGVLSWQVDGSAVPGTDYNAPQTSVNLSGAVAVQIPITLLDDEVITPEVRTIEISLNGSSQYRVGANQTHTIYLEDNDSAWAGTFSAGFTSFDFTLETITKGATTVGTLVSTGDGSFPAGSFPMTNVVLTATEFSATVPGIVLPEGSSFARFPLSRGLVLQAGSGSGGHFVSADFIQGSAIERIGSSNGQPSHVDREVEGTFVMAREVQDPGIVTPPLVDAKRQEAPR